MMDSEYILFEEIVADPPPLTIGRPTINLTNFHSGVWAVLHTLSDDETLTDEEQEIFLNARDALDDFIAPNILYEIMKDEAHEYSLAPQEMIVYANDIIKVNEEVGKIYDAQ